MKKLVPGLLSTFESLVFWLIDSLNHLLDILFAHLGDIVFRVLDGLEDFAEDKVYPRLNFFKCKDSMNEIELTTPYNFEGPKGDLYTLKCGHIFNLPSTTSIPDPKNILCPKGCDLKNNNACIKPIIKLCIDDDLQCQICLEAFNYEDYHFLKAFKCGHTFGNDKFYDTE